MKRTTFLVLVTVALWTADLGMGYAKPVPDKCAACHIQTDARDVSRSRSADPRSQTVSAVFPLDVNRYEPGRARMTGSLFQDSAERPGLRTLGKSASPLGAYTFATTGLRG